MATEQATVAAGCFWGVEHLYRKNFGSGKGLLDAKVGYCGGQTDDPNYRAVCSGSTGRKFILAIRCAKDQQLCGLSPQSLSFGFFLRRIVWYTIWFIY